MGGADRGIFGPGARLQIAGLVIAAYVVAVGAGGKVLRLAPTRFPPIRRVIFGERGLSVNPQDRQIGEGPNNGDGGDGIFAEPFDGPARPFPKAEEGSGQPEQAD